MRSILAAFVAAAFLTASTPGTAAHGAAPGARLTVTVKPASGPVWSARLTCDPTGGDHPYAADACATLAQARGNPRRIQPRDGMCTMEYAPATAGLNGRWHGRQVRYRETFGNACVLALATGAVFAL